MENIKNATVCEKNVMHEKACKEYLENAPLTIDKISTLRFQSEKWNELYLKTFKRSAIENRELNDDTLAYYGKKIAVIVTKANFKRSGSAFDYRLYLSVCGYDYFTGNSLYTNVGGDEVISEAVRGLIVAMDKGARHLDDEVCVNGAVKTAFKYACYRINKYIHAQRNVAEKNSGFDIERIGAVSAVLRDIVPQHLYMEILDIIEHIKLTPMQLRYIDFAVNGNSRRKIAEIENKHPSTVCEAFKAIQKKFIKYCTENELNTALFAFITPYID